MKKIFFVLFCILAGIQTASAANAQMREVPCDQRLQKCWKKILELPSAKQLVAQIQREGPIRIKVVNHAFSDQFGAYWDRQDRVIGIHLSSKVSEGDIIGSIIFELHNALTNSQVDHLDNLALSRRIGREKYVEAMELLEYQNSKKASAMAQEGIKRGLFPANAHLPTYSSFEEHYYYQKISGHSALFAQAYDSI